MSTDEESAPAKRRRRTYLGCTAGAWIGLLAMPLALYLIARPNFLKARVRAEFALVQQSLYMSEKRLDRYMARQGSYPPGREGIYYGALTDDLTSEADNLRRFPETGDAFYKGPPIDVFRKEPAFGDEKPEKAWFCDGKNSEMFCWYSGYRPRYYRSADGHLVLLISNAPDADADLGEEQINKIGAELRNRTSIHQRDVWAALARFRYDPTNGTISDGDQMRIVEPKWEEREEQEEQKEQ